MLVIMHGLALIVTIVIGTETALGLVFDPRDKGFSFCGPHYGGGPFCGYDAAQPPQERNSPFGGIDICRRIFGGGYPYGT